MMILGIDAGGTHSRAAVVNENGNLLALAYGGPANFRDIGIDEFLKRISSLVDSLDIGRKTFDSAFVGVSGMGFKGEDKRYFAKLLSKVISARKIGAVNDCHAALVGAIAPKDVGICIIAGTGNMTIGISKGGEVYRAGGWGHLLGDPGSAFGLSYEAFKIALKTVEKRENAFKIAKIFQKEFGITDIDDYLEFFYSSKSKSQLASIAPRIIKLAENGDMHSKGLVLDQIKEIVDQVITVSKIVKSRHISYSGGMFKSEYFKEKLREELLNQGFELVKPTLPPLGGALILGISEVKEVNKGLVNNIKSWI
ncbi:MAG: hypothetical protein J7L34_03580 [Thermotogaceae bacterium]|nr:hypothetical protein [Thermotogaceae bacterium]